MNTWSLKRTHQCVSCPWIKSNSLDDIPNYKPELHDGLRKTIAHEGVLNNNVMACHKSEDAHCIGWLVNQINQGNNISMRLKMLSCSNAKDIKLIGEQHENFEETFKNG